MGFFTRFLDTAQREGKKNRFFGWLFHNDIPIIVAALLCSHFAHYVIRYLYPITGEPTMYWLYTTLFGLTRGSLILGFSYLVLRYVFPGVFRYFETSMRPDMELLTKYQKICVSLFVYFLLTLVFLLSAITL